MPQNSPGNPVETLVRSASRRRHRVILLKQLSYALIVLLGGVILLLLVGTQILAWYWLALLALIGCGTGVIRLRGRTLPHYQVAQILDRRLHLSDTLSTGWFVLTTPLLSNPRGRLQLRQAEQLAANVQPSLVFPYEGQRAWALSALLLVIACGLFGLRYFAYDQLTFHRSLVPMPFGSALEQIGAKFRAVVKHEQNSPARKTHPRMKAGNELALQGNRAEAKGNQPANRDVNELGKDAANSVEARTGSRRSANAREGGTKPEDDVSKDNLANRLPAPNQKGSQQAAANDTKKNGGPTARSSPGEQSLTSKLREALSGLLAKMQGGASPQAPNADANQPPGAKSDRDGQPSSKSRQSTSESAASKQTDANALLAQQQARSAEMASASKGQGSGDSSGHRSSDNHSAAGHQDGSKEAREAEQLKAMGKLAEIIGRRSASVKGEMTIETSTGSQQLQTNYTNKSGRHSGIGGDIDHDQVPVEDQQYVREYMKQVHSQGETR